MLQYGVDVCQRILGSSSLMKFISIVLTLFMAMASTHADAAKRMGGGKSFGQQSGNVTQRDAARRTPTSIWPCSNKAVTD